MVGGSRNLSPTIRYRPTKAIKELSKVEDVVFTFPGNTDLHAFTWDMTVEVMPLSSVSNGKYKCLRKRWLRAINWLMKRV